MSPPFAPGTSLSLRSVRGRFSSSQELEPLESAIATAEPAWRGIVAIRHLFLKSLREMALKSRILMGAAVRQLLPRDDDGIQRISKDRVVDGHGAIHGFVSRPRQSEPDRTV